ncbi:MAG TPA: cytochrome c [Sphingobacteriaceae bacterium]
MKIHRLIPALLTASITLLYACTSSEGQQQGNNETSAPGETTAAVTEPAAAADPEARSESKGVGRFTSVKLDATDPGLAAKGEVVFTSKCGACHKTTDEKLVGPGLKDVTVRRTPEWIMNMITNPEEMTKKDPVAQALLEKHLVQMTFQNVSDEETRQILEFFRKNDAN